ncbi:FdhD protein [Otariodibacter oris]|uniref:Sulfur carrier protein FdhD n=1 Tax=Otariodibacter oris TaxID=1032623 RepID=A0A420XI00_9PAST|nr:FdhD protein [Otariodibacter oris]
MSSIIKISSNRIIIENGSFLQQKQEDNLIREVPIALVYNGISHVVMMSTPSDLEDFALGFSLSEGIIVNKNQLFGLDIIEGQNGIEIEIEIATRQFVALKEKRRSMTGRTGCGICGVEQLEQVQQNCKLFPKSNRLQNINPLIFDHCLEQLEQSQTLSHQTGASHAAAFFTLDGKLLAIREDVGRHVALDKLLGWYAKAGEPIGFVFVTSRASFEMVQKCLACGVEMLCAISATTEMAYQLANENNFTLLAFTRKHKTTVYTGSHRLNLA